MPARSEIDYVEAPIRAFAIATMFWGVVGFLMGVIIASQLAWPLLNLDLQWTSFGRLRPVHTSAVIFAFGGNALLGTSLYIVQRTCRARLFGGNDMGWFLFFGYQFFIVTAALGYVLGVTQGKEYAEPEWYVDLWLTLVWVLYLAAFPAAQRRLMELCVQELALTQDQLVTVGRRHAEQRVAAFLISLSVAARRRAEFTQQLDMPMTRAEIGDLLGLALETVSRAFTALRKRGLVIEHPGHRVELPDLEALALVADGV